MFALYCTYCAPTNFFVDFALVPSHALGASTSRAATLFYSLIDPFDAEPLTLVFHLPILTQTWPSTGKTVLHPFTFKCLRIKNQWLWAGRQKKLWLHSFERGRHWLHFQSPKWQFSMHHHAVPIDVDWLSSKTSFLLHHAVPIGCWPVIKLLTYLLTSEWPTSTDCSPKKEIPEKTSKA